LNSIKIAAVIVIQTAATTGAVERNFLIVFCAVCNCLKEFDEN